MLSESAGLITNTEQDDQAQDGDSLFGSPPPSPGAARGRSPSPILALPSESSVGSQTPSLSSSAQNVGTIALPGSHAHSEQPINPIAISLSLPGGSCIPVLPQSLPSSRPHSRHEPVGAGRNVPPGPVLPPRPRSSPEHRRVSAPSRKQLKRKSQEPAPHPPPAIILPDPSQPPPRHFLRNQQALLGHAGLVARIQPSKLSTSVTSPRGATPSNPIILEDSETQEVSEPPIIGRSHIDYFRSLDPSQLPAPTNQEIVEMLIKQKDIFPVLQSILKLIAAGALGGSGSAVIPTGVPGSGLLWSLGAPDQSRSSPQPPAKRRKLRRVPAGAADWDVPYPFQEGEGPTAYKQNWEKDRGRQLISQLIGLVKIAARKAAAKKHLVELQQKRRTSSSGDRTTEKQVLISSCQEGKGGNHYRDENGKPNLAATTLHRNQLAQTVGLQASVSRDSGGLGSKSSWSTVESSAPISTTPSFGDLFSALLAASSEGDTLLCQPLGQGQHLEISTLPQPTTNLDVSSPSDGNAGQSIVDSWMDFFQTFQGDLHPSESASLETLLGLDSPITGDVSSFASPSSGDLSSFSSTPNPDVQPPQNFPPLDFGQLGNLDFTLGANTGSSNGLGSFSPMSDSPTPMDFTLGFLSAISNSQIHTSTAEENLPAMDIDEPISPSAPLICTASIPAVATHTDLSSLIDPQLLALSAPDQSITAIAPHPPSTSQSQNSQATTPDGPASTFLPSPVSSFDPATPSSAGWDMSMHEVIVTESERDQGGIGLSKVTQGNLGCKEVVSVGDAHPKIPEILSSEVTTNPALAGDTSELNAQLLATSDHSLQIGVFQVLRATDLQPPRSAPKLKKSEVLKRAEEKRRELKAKLDQMKMKLWEVTIEHGALLHLMKAAEEAEKSSGSPSSRSS